MFRNIPIVLLFLQIISQMAQAILSQRPSSYSARMRPDTKYVTEAPPHAFPFLGIVVEYVGNQWELTGDNALILSERVVMTARFDNQVASNMRILAGVYNASVAESSQQTRDVCYKESFLGGYVHGQRYYDILYLSEPLTFNEYVSSIPIDGVPPGRVVPDWTNCTVVSFLPDVQIDELYPTVAHCVTLKLFYCDYTANNLVCPGEPGPFILFSDRGAPLLCPYEDRIVLYGVATGDSGPPRFFAVNEMDKTAIANAVNKGRETCGGY